MQQENEEILNNQWMRDVLRRFLYEGRLDAGSISCDKSLQRLIKLGFVVRIDEDDMDYQFTNKAADFPYLINKTQPKFVKGDYVTLCPIEFDCTSFDEVLRVQFIENDKIFLSTIAEYNPYNNGKVVVLNIEGGIELSEVYHATFEECQTGIRR